MRVFSLRPTKISMVIVVLKTHLVILGTTYHAVLDTAANTFNFWKLLQVKENTVVQYFRLSGSIFQENMEQSLHCIEGTVM